MSEEVLKIAQGPVLWGISIVTIALVVLQAVLIYRLTRKFVNSNKIMTKEEQKIAIKTGAIVSIGPAVSVFILGLTMINLLGAPVTLMRIGIIGSANTEMIAASLGTAVAGVALGSQELTMTAFATALFAMAVMSTGYLVGVPLISRGLGKPLQRIMTPEPGKKPGALTIFFGAVFPLLFFAMLAATQISQGLDYLAVMVVSAVIMFVLDKIAKVKNINWLKEWAMGIAVLASIFTGPLFAKIF